MADVDDGSSTESESFEPDQEEHVPVNASVESTTPISTTLGINILDLQAVLLSAPPAPVAPPPSKPTTGSFVIPRRPIPKPTDTPQSSRCGSTSDHSRAPPPDAFPRHCKHSLTHPIVARAKPQVETFSCTCCERKEMDASNFSKTQRKEYKALTRKCRDCTCDLPLTSAVRRQSRERRRSQDKRTPAPERRIEERRTDAMRQEPRSSPQQSTTPTRIPCQRRLQQIRETRAEERCSDVQRTSGGWRREETGQQRTLGRREQLTPAQKKQIKRQKRMQEKAEIDRIPPPPRTTRPPRASAQKAHDEWRSDPRIRASGYADMHQQLHERESSRARMLGAASRVGKENGHSKRPRPSFSDNTGYN